MSSELFNAAMRLVDMRGFDFNSQDKAALDRIATVASEAEGQAIREWSAEALWPIINSPLYRGDLLRA